MTAELETFAEALDVFCRSLSHRVVHLAEDGDVMSLRVVHEAVSETIGNLLEVQFEVEELLNRG